MQMDSKKTFSTSTLILCSSLPYLLPTNPALSNLLYVRPSGQPLSSAASYIPGPVILQTYSSHHVTLFKNSSAVVGAVESGAGEVLFPPTADIPSTWRECN